MTERISGFEAIGSLALVLFLVTVFGGVMFGMPILGVIMGLSLAYHGDVMSGLATIPLIIWLAWAIPKLIQKIIAEVKREKEFFDGLKK